MNDFSRQSLANDYSSRIPTFLHEPHHFRLVATLRHGTRRHLSVLCASDKPALFDNPGLFCPSLLWSSHFRLPRPCHAPPILHRLSSPIRTCPAQLPPDCTSRLQSADPTCHTISTLVKSVSDYPARPTTIRASTLRLSPDHPGRITSALTNSDEPPQSSSGHPNPTCHTDSARTISHQLRLAYSSLSGSSPPATDLPGHPQSVLARPRQLRQHDTNRHSSRHRTSIPTSHLTPLRAASDNT